MVPAIHGVHWWRLIVEIAGWGLAGAWAARVWSAVRNLPGVPDLTSSRWDTTPAKMPGLAVVVPACNEAADIAVTLDSLLAQDYRWMQIIAVNDRSTDATGAIIDSYAGRFPERMRAVHISELPSGWLGKTHAMHVAAEESRSEYVLFTDADVSFSPSILRRALTYAEQEQAAHLVIGPTPILKLTGEGVVLGAFQVIGLWVARPWRVADPEAKRDVAGVGAFNLLRRDALEKIGGLTPQRLVVLEDVALGQRIKAARLPQRIAFAPGAVSVHWAAGANGLIRTLTKNLFSGMNFNPLLLLAGCSALLLLFLLPVAGLFWWPTLLPCLLVMACIGTAYRTMGRITLVPARYGWLFPFGVAALIWALLRSALAAWIRNGVVWRGTHYPLLELRKHNSPFQWERAAAKARREAGR